MEVEQSKEYASKGTGNAGLALGIIGTAGWLLNGLHGGGFANLFNNGVSATAANDVALATGASYMLSEIDTISKQECDDRIALLSTLYENKIAYYQDRCSIRERDVQEKFQLFLNDNLNAKNLLSLVDDIKTQLAVLAAKEPLQDLILSMQMNGIASSANAAIALEAERRANAINLETERRCCADNKIVNYVNSEFYPINVADVTVGTTSTGRSTYNPLCGCCTPTYCNQSVATLG